MGDGRLRMEVIPLDRVTSEKKAFRALIHRQSPSGDERQKLRLDVWLKDLAPSPGLAEWFRSSSTQWARFCDRYFRELESKPSQWQELVEIARREPVTLICATDACELKATRALREFLSSKLGDCALPDVA